MNNVDDQLRSINSNVELTKAAIQVLRNRLKLGHITQYQYDSDYGRLAAKLRLLKDKYRRVKENEETS